MGDPELFRKSADVLDGMGDDIADALAEKAGGTREEWRALMRAETWYSDEEAVEAGLADEVAGAASGENTFDLSILNIFKKAPSAPNSAPLAASAAQDNTELVRAALAFQRDTSRRQGVAV